MIEHVLVPLDGSLLAEKALTFGQKLLAPNGKLTLVAAVEAPLPPVYAYPSPDVFYKLDSNRVYMETAKPQAHAYLDGIAERLRKQGYAVQVEADDGSPAEVITELAKRHKVDAIVMSTHGRSGISRLVFGSVTNKVLSMAPCPVVVVPNQPSDEKPK
jgi:nucleotide-binding universal stress UspA family protein